MRNSPKIRTGRTADPAVTVRMPWAEQRIAVLKSVASRYVCSSEAVIRMPLMALMVLLVLLERSVICQAFRNSRRSSSIFIVFTVPFRALFCPGFRRGICEEPPCGQLSSCSFF